MGIAVVTGCSTGIGLATVVELARSGHEVFAGVRNPEGAEELRAAIDSESLPVAITRIDVDSDDSVASAFASILADRGYIDALVNNAGIACYSAFEDLPIGDFRKMMETNYFGPIRCIKAVLPGMRERRAGCIINVTSTAGRVALGGHAAYTGSKFALEAVSEVLAQELRAFGIRVAVVEPGVIKTPIFDKLREPPPSMYPHEARLRRFDPTDDATPPEAVARLIRHIMESDSHQLRYPSGDDAAAVLELRASMTDEEWISANA
jgi:NAD(P)-dependent dehydrogenase (short-subunit alcohol dehydrogenase family)